MTSPNVRLIYWGTVGLWLLGFVLGTAVSFGEHIQATIARGVLSLEGAALCVAAAAAALAWDRRNDLPLETQFAPAAVFIAAASLQAGGVAYLVSVVLGLPLPRSPLMSTLHGAEYYMWLYLAWAAIYLSIRLSHRLHEQEIRSARAVAASLQAQNSMLRYQINPHFLFNTMNAIATLIFDRKNDVAEEMVLAVSQFLRFALKHGLDDRVPLRSEIEAQQLYLSIERVRFGERFAFSADVPEHLSSARLPSLILQPLVENAVKYAVAPTTSLVRVSIIASETAGRLQIAVEDTGAGAAASSVGGLGVGLGNVRSRLETLYGDRAELICEQIQPQGFRVRLIMPLEFT